MIAVAVIGILAIIAIPSMGRANRDAATFASAVQLSDLFREARARAIGRNAAMLVRMQADGRYVLLEPAGLATDPRGPTSSCGAPTSWANARAIHAVQVDAQFAGGEQIVSVIRDVNPRVLRDMACACFTSLGRTYFGDCPAGDQQFFNGPPLAGAFSIVVNRQDAHDAPVGLFRIVAVPPSGVSRVRSSATIGEGA